MGINLKKHSKYPDEILIRVFKGVIKIDDVLASWKSIKSNPLLNPSTKGIISDLSNCDFQMNMEGFKEIITYLKTQEYLKSVKLAVITDSPKDIVFPMLGETTEKNLQIKPFCTEQAAVNWILNG